MNRRSLILIPLIAGCIVALVVLWALIKGGNDAWGTRGFDLRGGLTVPSPSQTPAARKAPAESPVLRELGNRLLAYLQETLQREDARSNEAILTFTDADALKRFIARAKELGFNILGEFDDLFMARIHFDSLAALQADIFANATDYDSVGANFILEIPTVPSPAVQSRALTNGVPVGNRLLNIIGATGDRSDWGRGVTIAILDSGVALGDPTFAGTSVRTLDIGLGLSPGTGDGDGHGTAVAGLAAGSATDAPGIASGANLLSIRVTGADGTSDVFTMAQGIRAAVDAGANIINISMGSYQTGAALVRAIDYATAKGAVIVASAGNDQAAQLTWPAADPRVISVGAVDALEQQVMFSNSGEGLKLTAPGLAIPTAWLDGGRISMDGTSASTPIVAGAIATIMSTTPGITAAEAARILQEHADDGGMAGTDADYGAGIINLNWTLNRSDVTRVDSAISSHYYNVATGEMQYVVQNRGAQVATALQLTVTTSGEAVRYDIPALKAGGVYAVKQSIDQAALAAAGRIVINTVLSNSAGAADQVPANNRKSSGLTPPVMVGGGN